MFLGILFAHLAAVTARTEVLGVGAPHPAILPHGRIGLHRGTPSSWADHRKTLPRSPFLTRCKCDPAVSLFSLFSGFYFSMNTERYLQSPFTQSHAVCTTFMPASNFTICYFEAKQGNRPKFVVETQKSKPKWFNVFSFTFPAILVGSNASSLA